MAAITLIFSIAVALLGVLAAAQSCPTNTTCPTTHPDGLLLLKSACPGPNVTMQQFRPSECINTAAFLPPPPPTGNDTTTVINPATAGTVAAFKATLFNSADFWIPELTLYPAADCNASASDAKTWKVRFTNRDRYGRKATACHTFKVGGKVPGSVRFDVRAVARRTG